MIWTRNPSHFFQINFVNLEQISYNFSGVHLHTLFCKLDHFITEMNFYSKYKNKVKFTLRKFYELGLVFLSIFNDYLPSLIWVFSRNVILLNYITLIIFMSSQGILKRKYHCTIGLLFDWFRLAYFEIKTKIVCSHTADLQNNQTLGL
jgi:hypothetical protein